MVEHAACPTDMNEPNGVRVAVPIYSHPVLVAPNGLALFAARVPAGCN